MLFSHPYPVASSANQQFVWLDLLPVDKRWAAVHWGHMGKLLSVTLRNTLHGNELFTSQYKYSHWCSVAIDYKCSLCRTKSPDVRKGAARLSVLKVFHASTSSTAWVYSWWNKLIIAYTSFSSYYYYYIIGYSIALGVKGSAVNQCFNQLPSFLIKCSVSYSLFQ